MPNWEKLARNANFQPTVMAALCPISLRQLERHFKSEFGKTPGQWTRELKCQLARQLISQGWSNKAVAVELGFGNEAHLCHEFKRVFGVSPQTFGPLYGTRPGSPAARHGSPISVTPRASDSSQTNGERKLRVARDVAFRQECRV
jgi:AraC-like DNA-binding protein